MSTLINFSPYMNLPVPSVSNTDGPQWAENINASLSLIDAHNHTPGMGVPITTAGLSINADLSFNNNSAINLKALILTPQSSVATAAAIYAIGTDLYFNNASTGTPVQITNGNSIAGTTGSITGLVSPASASYVAPTFVWQSAANTPANMDGGAFIFRNISVNSKGLTLSPPAGMASDYSLVLPSLPASQKIMTLDASGNISAPYSVDGSTIVINTNVISVGTVTNSNIADNSINGAKIVDHSITGQQLVAGALEVGSGARNFLINSAFDYWQRGTTGTAANGTSTYVADRWYAKNSLGTNGVLTMAQVAGVTVGSQYGCSVKISTAPTAGQTNGCELYQTLDNLSSRDLFGRAATITAQVKALGNVTQVGIQFYYATSETKVTTAIGSETLLTVNSSTFTLGTVDNQTLTAATITANGVVGMRIRIAAVSSGNTYDINNGFIVEQVTMRLYSAYTLFTRQGSSAQQELALCQRYFEKSYDVGTNPASTTLVGADFLHLPFVTAPAAPFNVTIPYKVVKRATPSTIKVYDNGGNINMMIFNGSAPGVGYPNTSGIVNSSSRGFSTGFSDVSVGPAVAVYEIGCHWTADAEI